MLFQLSYLNSNFGLTLGYLNPALNNWAHDWSQLLPNIALATRTRKITISHYSLRDKKKLAICFLVIIIQTFSPLELSPHPNGKHCSINIIFLTFPCVRLLEALVAEEFFIAFEETNMFLITSFLSTFPSLANVSQCARHGNYVVLSTALPRITGAYLKFRLRGRRL